MTDDERKELVVRMEQAYQSTYNTEESRRAKMYAALAVVEDSYPNIFPIYAKIDSLIKSGRKPYKKD